MGPGSKAWLYGFGTSLLLLGCDPTVATNRGAGATVMDSSQPNNPDASDPGTPDARTQMDASSSTPDASVPDAMVAMQRARVVGTASTLNLRSGPSTDDTVVGSIPEGCLVTLLGETQGAWEKVDYRGTVGWAHSDYLSNVQSDAADCSL